MAMKKRYITNWNDVPVVVDLAYVAIILGVTPETIRNEIKKGNIPATRVGHMWRILKEDLMAYLGVRKESVIS